MQRHGSDGTYAEGARWHFVYKLHLRRRRNANTGQGRRRLNARAALRQQERSSSPVPSSAPLGRPASPGALPEPGGQEPGCPQPQTLPLVRTDSASILERIRFLPSRLARYKTYGYGSV